MLDLKIHHIGYAIESINEGIKIFETLGFNVDSDVFDDLQRNVKIVFMSKDEIRIELVSPLKEDSPVNEFLSRNGASPYHICYRTDEIHKTIEELKKLKFMQITPIEPAVAISNKKVVFLYSKVIGIVELVEGV